MLRNDSDRDWERLGAADPYWAVVTHDNYRASSMTPENMAKFFASGEQDVAALFAAIERHVAPGFTPASALDFGCGVGRLLIPLARRCGEVTGVDVSDAMLAEARKNCSRSGIRNVLYAKSDDALSELRGDFTFVHSYIVLQHIPVRRGERITRRLIGLLSPGGIGALHYTYETRHSPRSRAVLWARTKVPFADAALNLIRHRKRSHAIMQLNEYSLNRLFSIIQDAGCDKVHAMLTDHGGPRGAILLFQKNSAS
jgi:2-polyprenyl-3-methyl-5-hydroxy-6-metoxy-1,4-benzoquinol methylase